MNDILLIKVNKSMSPEKLDEFRSKILEQKKEGLIVLPMYCEYALIPGYCITTTVSDADISYGPYNGGFTPV